ncbi:16S rRNA (cytosine(1402)-N(4))-methyltransferase RsmH [Blattabacterium cuenoti]|uniref:16S rRNA (cytosine(1402)-N(4))-methyltransferase RsmH n=1 Tax=Blattabacterium cuenoti TaxID=1653831 RepID=UPI00163C8C33|nr:16S rRNA (cytosine(1402)-N(4))-methyltransferase RsmH [Blattabacterium cuenoti]
MNYYHKPVLLKESIDHLVTDKHGIYVDVTFGGGGHSYEILKKLKDKAILIALDKDYKAIQNNSIIDKRFYLFHENFVHIKHMLKKLHIEKISGLLADLGISSTQIDDPERGFTHQKNCILDMRMDQNNAYTAIDVLNKSSKEKLLQIFFDYGDFKNAKNIAEKILENRLKKPIITTFDLVNIFLRKKKSFKCRKRFFSRIFQAIRIEVNNEINVYKNLLFESSSFIMKGGRLVILTYHSIEDRITKYFLKRGVFFNERIKREDQKIKNIILPFKMVCKKVIRPNRQEIINNPRSKSAKLRIAEKL